MPESIRVTAGDVFELKFAANPTAGYLWKLSIPPEDAAHVALVKPPTWQPNYAHVAVAILQTVSFRPGEPGTVTLTYQYQRDTGMRQIQEERVYEVIIEPEDMGVTRILER